MRYKLYFACLFVSFSSAITLADTISEKFCADKELRNPAYGLFLQSTTMKHKFTNLYQTLDHQLDNYFAEACFSKKDFNTIKKESLDICIKTCDRNADTYAKDKMFGKYELGREIFNECSSLCHAIDYSYWAFNKGLEAAKKISNDCTNPSKDSISTLGRSMKEVEKHHPSSDVHTEAQSK